MKTRNDFPELLNSLGLHGIGVEVGVDRGDFAAVLAAGWDFKELYLVDPWSGEWGGMAGEDIYLAVRLRFQSDPRIRICRTTSRDGVIPFAFQSVDFAYIDADHTYESVKSNLWEWWPKVKPGGILAGHDYTDRKYMWGQFGVKQAVTEFAVDNGLSVNVTTDEGDENSWWIIR